jgi:hypothetical protein
MAHSERMDEPGGAVCVPVVIAFPSPFRLVKKANDDAWDPSLKDINELTYDYAKLNRVSTFIDGNVAPYAMIVGFDGSLVLPAFREFMDKQHATAVFNRVLAEMLLGGLYTEAVAPTDITHGLLYPTGYVRMRMNASSASGNFHSAIRLRTPNPSEAIQLIEPLAVTAQEFEECIQRGRKALAKVSTVSPDILLAGATHFVRGQFSEALVILWTSIEQIVSHMWDSKIRDEDGDSVEIPGRRSFLDDHRTWPASTRIELLFQRRLLGADIYKRLDLARKARNAFIHSGNAPTQEVVTQALRATFGLLSLCVSEFTRDDDLAHVANMVCDRLKMDRIYGGEQGDFQPSFWREFLKIPGEEGWEGNYETFDLGLIPIQEIEARKLGPKAGVLARRTGGKGKSKRP